jgi:hypothetical protein
MKIGSEILTQVLQKNRNKNQNKNSQIFWILIDINKIISIYYLKINHCILLVTNSKSIIHSLVS